MRPMGCKAVLLVLSLSVALTAQTYQGRILGTVTDQSGAVVPNARVTITNPNTGYVRNIVTTSAGDYLAPALPPGLYDVVVEAPNFKRSEQKGIRLEVAKDVRIDAKLEPGAATESVTVTGEAPLIESTNDTLGGTFSNKTINDLPLNGRDFQNLVVLRPGVQRAPGGGFLSISSRGNRPEDNNFIVDGTDNNDPYYATTVINAEGVQGTPGTHMPIDAIQEFNAMENPPAEYGWKPGAIVNLGLKSGTNQLHGTAYDFERNSAFDARNWYNPRVDPSSGAHVDQRALRLHQFGGSLGGPIKKDKLFFFVAYEGVRDTVSNSDQLTTPQTTSGGGREISIPDAMASLAARGIPVNPFSLQVASLFPANSDPTGAFNVGLPNTNREDNGIAKVDYVMNEKNRLTGRYFIGDSLQTERDIPVLRPEWMSESVIRAQVFGTNWTYSPNSTWVNELKFGYNRFWQSILTVDHAADPVTTYGINTGVTNPVDFGMPFIQIFGFNQLGGQSGWPLLTTPNETYQIVDNVSYTRGKHNFRFGGEWRYGKTDNLRDRFGKGRIRFFGDAAYPGSSALEDFLAGLPGDGRIFVGDSHRHVHIQSFGAFIQDDWRITNRFTVNAGLRYELNTVIKERDDLLGNFDPAVGLIQVGRNGVDAPYNGDHNNFAPRLGLAWDIWGNGNTVFRAGGAMIYEIPHLAAFLGQNGVNNASTAGLNVIPTGVGGTNTAGAGGSIVAAATSVDGTGLNWSSAGPIFNVNPDCDPTTGSPCDILGVDRNLKTPYVFTWNANVQQAFGKNTSLQLGYVGNRGQKLYRIIDVNQFDPITGTVPFESQFPFLGYINFMDNGYSSTYHGMEVTLTQRPWNGVSFVLGYTWSHSQDFVSLNRANQPQDSRRPDLEWGNSDLDVRHRLTISNTWELPSKKGSWGTLLAGWQINNIVTFQSGLPWTAWDFGNDVTGFAEFSDRWNFLGDPSDFEAVRTGSIPFFDFSGVAYDPTTHTFGAVTDASTVNQACINAATTPGLRDNLASFGCFAEGSSILYPTEIGVPGNSRRNMFRAPRYMNWDFSIMKNFQLTERVGLQLRGEFFNILNHPVFANPATSFNNDLSTTSTFGCSCATPDVAAANPVVGSGGARNIQLGVKFRF